MGTIIGQKGFKIKHIQDVSGARMVASKEMLPQSTERIVEVQGDANSIRLAIWEIGKCLVDDWQRGNGTILYDPLVRSQGTELEGSTGTGGRMRSGNGGMGGDRYQERGSRGSYTRTGNGADFSDHTSSSFRRTGAPTSMRTSDRSPSAPGQPMVSEDGEEYQTQNISIPADMVGCIIGRAGSRIQEIRRSSGSKISIAKAAHDETGERLFTLIGTPAANEKALYLLYENLEAEKIRRSSQGSPGHE
jgi:heterogeneous nuclear rnp K-like protein 2